MSIFQKNVCFLLCLWSADSPPRIWTNVEGVKEFKKFSFAFQDWDPPCLQPLKELSLNLSKSFFWDNSFPLTFSSFSSWSSNKTLGYSDCEAHVGTFTLNLMSKCHYNFNSGSCSFFSLLYQLFGSAREPITWNEKILLT